MFLIEASPDGDRQRSTVGNTAPTRQNAHLPAPSNAIRQPDTSFWWGLVPIRAGVGSYLRI